MKKTLQSVVAALALGAFSMGCSGGDKCEKAVDKVMDMAMDMAAGMAAGMGGDQADEMKKQMTAEFEKAKPEALKQCQEALKKDKAGTEKSLDCILEAKDLSGLEKCEGNFMKM